MLLDARPQPLADGPAGIDEGRADIFPSLPIRHQGESGLTRFSLDAERFYHGKCFVRGGVLGSDAVQRLYCRSAACWGGIRRMHFGVFGKDGRATGSIPGAIGKLSTGPTQTKA
jgi:hypothetical protein